MGSLSRDMSLHKYGGGFSISLRSHSARRSRAIVRKRRSAMFLLQLPFADELELPSRQRAQLLEQMQATNATVSWLYDYVELFNAQSTFLLAGDDEIFGHIVFAPVPVDQLPRNTQVTNIFVTHVLRRSHRYDGRGTYKYDSVIWGSTLHVRWTITLRASSVITAFSNSMINFSYEYVLH